MTASIVHDNVTNQNEQGNFIIIGSCLLFDMKWTSPKIWHALSTSPLQVCMAQVSSKKIACFTNKDVQQFILLGAN